MSPEELTALVELAAQTAEGEVVTHALSRDVTLPHAGSTAVLITLDNGHDHSRPNTLGPRGLGELGGRRSMRPWPGTTSRRSPSPASRSSSPPAPISVVCQDHRA